MGLIEFFKGTGILPDPLAHSPGLVVANAVADLVLMSAYFTAAGILTYLVIKKRAEANPLTALWALSFAVLGCGRALSIWTLWYPNYNIQIVLKSAAAVAIGGTVVVLWRYLPILLTQATRTDLEHLATIRTSELEQANADLHEALYHKEILLREVHHRVKNNLSIVTSLLRLHEKKYGEHNAFEDVTRRVMAIARVHEQLQTADDLDYLDVWQFLRLMRERKLLIYLTPKCKVTFDIDAYSLFVPFDLATPLSLIMTEVLSNVFRHAFAGRPTGHIHVILEENDGVPTIRVIDNGVGFCPEDVESDSLGTKLVKALAVQLGGPAVWKSTPGEGTEFILPMQSLVAPQPVSLYSSGGTRHPSP